MTEPQPSDLAAPADERPSPPAARAPLGRPVWIAWLLLGLAIALCTHDAPGSWADASRLGAIESLVERGTLALDDSTYFWQGDKVWFEPHYYSHQPPMLGLLGALPYGALHHGLGLSIDSPGVYRTLTLALTGLPAWLGLLALGALCRRAGASPGTSAALVLTGGLATILFPYTLVLNQHGTAAGLVLLALWSLDRRAHATGGLLLALASTIDMSAMFPALAGAWPVLRAGGWLGLVRYGLGALPPTALHLSVNYAIAGDLVPLALHREAFEYPMSPFLLSSLTGVDQALFGAERWYYVKVATFGASGLFSHHPILLAALLAGLALPFTARGGGPRLSPGLLTAVGLGSLGIALFYLFGSLNLSGSAFGMRWFAVFAPLLMLYPASLAGRRRAAGRRERPGPVGLSLLGVLVLWSSAANLIGARNPWAKFHYRWEDDPRGGRVALPGESAPSVLDHWRQQWARLGDKPRFEREWYDLDYQTMLDQHRKLYLRPTPWLDEAGREAWIRQGLAKLHRVVDQLDAARLKVDSRVHGHFWLGKFYAALGDKAEAEREYERTLLLHPTYPPARQALEQLRAEPGQRGSR